MPSVVCAILGGGRGTRLFPLTKERCKPAVPVAGKYRLIDIPVSNCLNSGYGRIFVITQFNTASLHRHISRTYVFDPLSDRTVEVLAAQQTLDSADWYQGTADAVRQNLRHLQLGRASHLLILSGDHLYRMDYRDMVRRHDESGADLTIAVQPVTAQAARALGALKLDENDTVTAFAEKPDDQALLDDLQLPSPAGSDPDTGEPLTHVASLGIYLFRPSVLHELLHATRHDDFGRGIIPAAIPQCKVVAFTFRGYWADIGTVSAFYYANLDMTDPLPRFNLHDENWPIYTRPRYLPPPKLDNTHLQASLVADGSIISGSQVQRSIVGLRTVMKEGCSIRDSVLLGFDNYEPASPLFDEPAPASPDSPPLGIGAGCHIEGAIVDKNVHMGERVVVRGSPGSGIDLDAPTHYVRNGIVVVPRAQIVPPGSELTV